jgi:hypothetical protein
MLGTVLIAILVLGAPWGVTKMVAQQQLGLLPDRKTGAAPLDRGHSPGSRADICPMSHSPTSQCPQTARTPAKLPSGVRSWGSICAASRQCRGVRLTRLCSRSRATQRFVSCPDLRGVSHAAQVLPSLNGVCRSSPGPSVRGTSRPATNKFKLRQGVDMKVSRDRLWAEPTLAMRTAWAGRTPESAGGASDCFEHRLSNSAQTGVLAIIHNLVVPSEWGAALKQ